MSMERQSFWWRTRAPEFSDLASSFLGLRGLAMAIELQSVCACVRWCFFLAQCAHL
jgi:hypothetical protein